MGWGLGERVSGTRGFSLDQVAAAETGGAGGLDAPLSRCPPPGRCPAVSGAPPVPRALHRAQWVLH